MLHSVWSIYQYSILTKRGAQLCPVAVPKISCSLTAHKILTAATPFASLHLPPAALGNVPTRTTLQTTSVLYQPAGKKSRFFRQLHHIAHLLHNAVVAALSVGPQAIGAVLDPLRRISVITAAVLPQSV